MFIAALFITTKKLKTTKCFPIGKWINKLLSICITEHYLAIKRNELLIHAPTQINLRGITLRDRSHYQNISRCRIPLSQKYKTVGAENKSGVRDEGGCRITKRQFDGFLRGGRVISVLYPVSQFYYMSIFFQL